MDRKTRKEQVTGTVDTDGDVVETPVGFIEIDEPCAEVEIRVGFTKNLGSFQSKRIDVSIRMPCKPSDVEKAHKWANKWAWEKMLESSNPPEEIGGNTPTNDNEKSYEY